ncbi:uncharacterized protein CELE_K02E11.4 [Caenorhabditis elegans]|nr:uncharacterized protein CELE_K02E11.4 [Caenorhabditis elegans]SOF58858.1 Conserved domain protein [Caenorhabditis elegans]|eukprot:NP_001343855.1 Uncharacterized protein CELE_K02E11.4 [Caenorhabditis elegans]
MPGGGGMMYGKVNATVTISLPVSANYRRLVNKKKVPSGVTTYNKNKKALIIKKMRLEDFGDYMTGNKKTKLFVMNQTW